MPVAGEDDVVAAVAPQRGHATASMSLSRDPAPCRGSRRGGCGTRTSRRSAARRSPRRSRHSARGRSWPSLRSGLGAAVDGDDRDIEPVELRVEVAGIARARRFLEPHVADVARVVVAGREHDVRAREPGERHCPPGSWSPSPFSVMSPRRRHGKGRALGLDLLDRELQQIGPEERRRRRRGCPRSGRSASPHSSLAEPAVEVVPNPRAERRVEEHRGSIGGACCGRTSRSSCCGA